MSEENPDRSLRVDPSTSAASEQPNSLDPKCRTARDVKDAETPSNASEFEDSEKREKTETVQYSSDGHYYLVARIGQGKFPDGGMVWLETLTHPLPIGEEWHTPNLFGAAVIRGRDYWRRFTRARLLIGQQTEIVATAVLVRDYAEFAWWTPGLQEAWAEAEGLHQTVTEMRRLRVCEKGDEREAQARRKQHGGQ